MVVLELVIAIESVRLDRVIALLDVLGQAERHRRGKTAILAATLQGQAHRVGVRHITLECILEGGLQLGGPIAIEREAAERR